MPRAVITIAPYAAALVWLVVSVALFFRAKQATYLKEFSTRDPLQTLDMYTPAG